MQRDGKSVRIGSRNLFASISGTGPVVVLCSGGGVPGVGAWDPIESPLSEFATVVTYDRAGVGHSEPPSSPPTAAQMVEDLRALLEALNLTTPGVLVGWSLSALLVQLYACEYPSSVMGLVLLDPTPDIAFVGFQRRPPALQEQIRSAIARNARNARQIAGGREAYLMETERMPESCEQVRSATEVDGKMPAVPIVVVTAGVRVELGEYAAQTGEFMTRAHERIARRVPHGLRITAERSSHRTMTSDEPDLIVNAIRSILDASTGTS